ncbi:MAG: acetyltransferase [Verrucomicrobiota bacterium]
MKKLIIVGAGGFGREIYAWAGSHPDANKEWKICGFLDDNRSALKNLQYQVPIIGTVEGHKPSPDEVYVCAIGDPLAKRRVCELLLTKSARFIRLVHPSAVIGNNVSLGIGVVICPLAVLTVDIEIGDFVLINCQTSAGHDSRIESWATISAHCDLTSGTRVGDSAFLGSGASIIPGKSVGKNAVVGAGSVVIRSVPDGVKVFGNPARQFS